MELIKAGLDYINISVDGVGDNYNKLRSPLNYDTTKGNITELYQLKEEFGKWFS